MPRQAPENEDDFLRMQQEAIRRVRDMQERARRTLENAGVTIERPLSNSANDSDMHMQDTVPLHEQNSVQREQHEPMHEETSAHRSEHQPRATSQHDQHEPMHGETNAHRSEHQPRSTSQHEPQVSHAGVTSSSVLNAAAPHIQGGLLSSLTGILPSFNLSLDTEQIMLLALCYMLFQDGADKFLIMALAYVVMT